MCGIAGIVNLSSQAPIGEPVLQRMIGVLHHRGPDGSACLTGHNFGLAHARLSIIDLAGGQQPIRNEDGSVWVVFNGEIFNYIELRQELEAAGHVFYTHTDTEVIVHLYEQYGDDFVQHMNGQFAIALWDKRRERLLLIRDRPGIHPLFYCEHQGQLYFASEIKSLIAGTRQTPRLDAQALDQLFTFWSVVPPRTLFQGIETVEPGQMLCVERGKITKRLYWHWDLSAPDRYEQGREADLADELRALLLDATLLRLRSDVPVGAYLSGGLDSSVITALIHGQGDVALRTFSITFPGSDLDESAHQRAMIDHLGADHSSVTCQAGDIASRFVKSIWHTESPILRTAPVPMGMLSELVHQQNFKVVLTGEGSDEVLGGYDIFKEAKIRQFWAEQPTSQLRPLLLKRLYPYLDTSQKQAQSYLQSFFGMALDQPDLSYFSHLPRWDTTAKCKMFFSDALQAELRDNVYDTLAATFPAGLERWHPFNRSQYIESKSLMAGYLLSSQGDRMLMMNSVEGRFPFLDHRVIEFANKLDPRLKMKVLNEKYLLKRAMQDRIPQSIVKRYKQPYRAPDIDSFFSGDSADYVDDLLSAAKLQDAGYFDAKRAGMLVQKIRKGRAISYKDNMAFVGMLSTQVWHHLFVDSFADYAQGGDNATTIEQHNPNHGVNHVC